MSKHIAWLVLCLVSAPAHAASPSYCGQSLPPGQKPSPVCDDARLRAIEAEEARAFAAARGRVAGNPALAAVLEQDEVRFLSQRDAIVANLAKVDPHNRKEKEEFHDSASLMRKRIALLGRIDGAARTTLRGDWASADGYLSIHERDAGFSVSLLAKRKLIGVDAVEDWLCRGMGETRGKVSPAAIRFPATIYRGDGENVPSRRVEVRLTMGMADVTFLAAGKSKPDQASPVCAGGGKITPAFFFPVVAAR